jgi:glycosyltransferase involved in cell wall biosynthesis
MKVAAFTGAKDEPSSRYRIRQYFDKLSNYDITIDDYSIENRYPPKVKQKRISWGIKSLFSRLNQVVDVNKNNYDCVIFQREMISTLSSFERFVSVPKILDVDDAIFLLKRGKFIKTIAQNSNAVICGNEFLAEKFKTWNPNVHIVPTAVDISKFSPLITKSNQSKNITIGWIGTSGGFKYVYKIEEALNYIINKYENVELLIVSDSDPKLKIKRNYKYIKWNSQKEVENFQKIDIGLMPLNDDEWTRGKCSYKMLQYMACGIPVVVSPFGMNADVLKKGNVGFGAKDYYIDWVDKIEYLINNEADRYEMGQVGRSVVQDYYSLEKLSQKLGQIIMAVIKEG